MQIDMHFYAIYAMARAAGIEPSEAYLIAHSSQFVDDAIDDDHMKVGEQAILPTVTSHKPYDFKEFENTSLGFLEGIQWKVWVPFHFLPGAEGDTFDEKMICRMDSDPARDMLEYVLSDKVQPELKPYAAGIAMHVYADTFAHYGFIGYKTELNEVKQSTIHIRNEKMNESVHQYLKRKLDLFFNKALGAGAEVTQLGHSAVATFPDRPFLKWEYQYEKGKKNKIVRNNPDDFLLACNQIYQFFLRYNYNTSNRWQDIKPYVRQLTMNEGTKDDRSEKWREQFQEGTLFSNDDFDNTVKYDSKRWKFSHIDFLLRDSTPFDCELNLFYRAAWMHRHFVLRELLPKYKLIG